MKEIKDVILPDGLHYAEDHEWVKAEDDTATIGISDYAQDQLGDIVFVELPQVGTKFQKGAEFGIVESVKAVSELYMPISGKIISVNKKLEDTPELVNSSPYDDGWLIAVKVELPAEIDALMTKDGYFDMLKG